MKKIIIVIILLVAGIGTGFLLGRLITTSQEESFKIKSIRTSPDGLVNPLLDYEISSNLYTKFLKLFKDDIQKTVDEKIKNKEADEIAVYFRSLTNGPWFGIKEDENFFPASLLKVPVMIAYFKWAEEDPKILEKEITYDKSYLQLLGTLPNDEYFKAENPIEEGKTYKVVDLIERMIKGSDNNAKNLLILNLDNPDRLLKVYTDLGLANQPELKSEEDILSVHEYATFLRILYNASYLDKNYSQKALELLTQTNFKQGLVARLPQDVEVAHKFGEHQDENDKFKQLHDCGIIYYPSYPYMLCVMTRGQDYNNLAKTIQDISYSVYQEIHTQIEKGTN
jgi:beta-lactamase class A